LRQPLGGRLVAKHVEVLRHWSDKGQTGTFAGAGERRALGQKSIARMNRVDSLGFGHRDDRVDIQIRSDRLATLRRADRKRFVGLESMQRETVFVTVDSHRAQAESSGGPEAADGDFRSIGDEQFPHTPQ